MRMRALGQRAGLRDQSMSKNWLPAFSASSETVVSVLMSLWITLTNFLSSSSLLALPMKRSASSASEYSSPRWADRNSMSRSRRSTSLPVWNEAPFFWWPLSDSGSSSSGSVWLLIAEVTTVEPFSPSDSSASVNAVAALRRRRKASTASCGLTM